MKNKINFQLEFGKNEKNKYLELSKNYLTSF